tara:strand:+ start:533 stop:1282 length:750 start_codon:yes stop_codon:yes gene_type:complete
VNYQLHYERLIEKARNRVLSGYVETHHVVPRCIGGTNERSNLVQLTAEEHFVAHQLLYKMHPHVSGLAFAMTSMTGNRYGKRSNKAYGWIRRKVAIAQSGVGKKRWTDPEFREKQKIAQEKVRERPGYREQFSIIHKGRVKSAQERANIAEAGRNRAPRKFSEQAKANMSASRLKTWAERRARGEHLLIAKKMSATRIKNGSYKWTDEQKAAIGKASLGRIPWNKGKTGYKVKRKSRIGPSPAGEQRSC